MPKNAPNMNLSMDRNMDAGALHSIVRRVKASLPKPGRVGKAVVKGPRGSVAKAAQGIKAMKRG